MQKLIAVFLFLVLVNPSFGMDLSHPRDKWAHAGLSATCAYSVSRMLSAYRSDGQRNFVTKHPRVSAFILCLIPGLAKEYLWDARPDKKDIWADLGGISAGLVFTFQF